MSTVKRRFIERLTSAVRRRVAFTWSRITCDQRSSKAIEVALDWIIRSDSSCPALTGEAIRTVLEFGERDAARRWADWLGSIQLSNGAMPDAESNGPSLFHTAYAAKGFLSIGDEDKTKKACKYLLSELEKVGPDDCLICLPLLSDAAQLWDVSEWREIVDRSLARCCRAKDLTLCDVSTLQFARRIESLIRLGRDHLASMALDVMPKANDRTGALVAGLLYRLGRHDEADRIMRRLVRKRFSATRESVWTGVYFLNAALLQVQSSFDIGQTPLPDRIEASDGRMQIVRRWFETLSSNAQVADVGCGSGRFLRRLIDSYPNARLTGVDVSQSLLSQLPEGAACISGSLLRIPLDDATMDGAFAVESVEHALIPDRAISELCRVVRPGGRVLVIDKDRAKQSLSEHDPWERWFTSDELARWLEPFCNDVTVEHVSHVEGQPGNDLFLAAMGTRHVE